MIEYWWPTEIGFYDNPNHKKLKLINFCYNIQKNNESGGKEWVSNETYNTSNNVFQIHKNKKFELLNSWIIESVNKYINDSKLDFIINGIESWFNIYKKGNYQEVHQHSNTILSAVYFLKSNKKSSPLVFRPPFIDQLDVKKINNFCCNCSIVYKPIPGRLIDFRGFVPHCVPQHKDNQDRITLSYNFR